MTERMVTWAAALVAAMTVLYKVILPVLHQVQAAVIQALSLVGGAH